jgi:hypothetical protein
MTVRHIAGVRMDFFQIIRSLENLLYEAMTWLIFYPRTLWRTVVRPNAIMAYTVEELRDTTEDRFADLLSPPLFLMLSLLIAHGVEKVIGVGADETAELLGSTGRMIVGSEQNLLLFRSFLFALFPLVAAVGLIRRKGGVLDRNSLKGPFYQQCYFGGTFGLAVSTAGALSRHPLELVRTAGLLLSVVGIVWYLWVQSRWIERELAMGWVRSAGLALWFFVLAAASGTAIGVVILRS